MTVQRRPRGSIVDPYQVKFVVERSSSEHYGKVAESLGITRGALMQLLMDNLDTEVILGYMATPEVQEELVMPS